jgi:hypothetical protein
MEEGKYNTYTNENKDNTYSISQKSLKKYKDVKKF